MQLQSFTAHDCTSDMLAPPIKASEQRLRLSRQMLPCPDGRDRQLSSHNVPSI